MNVSFKHNIREVERGLSQFAARQVPFAASLALNATAQDVKAAVDRDLAANLANPTAFTRRAYGVLRSSKSKLAAAVFAKDAQAKYLALQESGGERTPAGRALVVPVKIRVNAFGNLARGAIKRALARPGVISGQPRPGSPGGIYERVGATAANKAGRALRLLVHYTAAATYRPRLGFMDRARATASARFPDHFARALAAAIASARR